MAPSLNVTYLTLLQSQKAWHTHTQCTHTHIQYSSIQSVVCELWKGKGFLWKWWHYNTLTQLHGNLPWRSVRVCPCAFSLWIYICVSAWVSVCMCVSMPDLMTSAMAENTCSLRWNKQDIYMLLVCLLFHPRFYVFFYPHVYTLL